MRAPASSARLATRLALAAGLALAPGTVAGAAPSVRLEVEPLWRLAADGSGAGWLAYELGASKALDARFYADRTPEAKAAAARKATALRVPVAAVKRLAAHFASDVGAVWPGAEKQFGALPIERVELWYAMDDRASVLVTVDGVRTWCVNARHLGDGTDPLTARLAMASELFRLTAGAQAPGRQEPPSLARKLQVEGLKLEALRRVVPGASLERVLGLDPQVQAAILASRKGIARAALAAFDGGEDPRLTENLFGHAGLTGRFLAAQLAAQMGPAESLPALARVPSRDYLFRVRPTLEAWAALSETWAPASP